MYGLISLTVDIQLAVSRKTPALVKRGSYSLSKNSPPKAFTVAKAFGGEFFDKLIRRFHKETANDKRILFFLSA